jgi:hypothetical protein
MKVTFFVIICPEGAKKMFLSTNNDWIWADAYGHIKFFSKKDLAYERLDALIIKRTGMKVEKFVMDVD